MMSGRTKKRCEYCGDWSLAYHGEGRPLHNECLAKLKTDKLLGMGYKPLPASIRFYNWFFSEPALRYSADPRIELTTWEPGDKKTPSRFIPILWVKKDWADLLAAYLRTPSLIKLFKQLATLPNGRQGLAIDTALGYHALHGNISERTLKEILEKARKS